MKTESGDQKSVDNNREEGAEKMKSYNLRNHFVPSSQETCINLLFLFCQSGSER